MSSRVSTSEGPERSSRVAADVRLLALADAVRGLTAPFSCGGTVSVEAPVELRLGSRRVRVEDVDGRLGKKLARHCPPAPFGVGGQTMYDNRVRQGRQLLARDQAFQVEGIPLAAILEDVRATLCPSDRLPPHAELYALNVYQAGGRFAVHKDTPRDPAVFATLVVRLPVSFRGGRLVLEHPEGACAFDWGDGYFERPDPLALQWAAFFADVDHEIETVRSGTRVTLTWHLTRAAGAETARPLPPGTGPLRETLRAVLADPAWYPEGAVLAVPCVHLYAQTPEGARLAGSLDSERAALLKGRDRLVAEVALELGLRAAFRPYLFEDCAGDSWALERDLAAADLKLFRARQLTPDELEALPLAQSAWEPGDRSVWLFAPPWSYRNDGRPDALLAPRRLVGEVEYSATGYFGNEGSDLAFYVAGALHLEIPERAAREVAPPPSPASDAAQPVDLIVLACKTNALRCRQLGTALTVTWRKAVRDEVPGMILTMVPSKRWVHGRTSYVSGPTVATRFDPNALGLTPLGLREDGPWDPRDHLDPSDSEDEIPLWFQAMLASGTRTAYEMEQVIPGSDPESLDDPITSSVDRSDAGDYAGAHALLMDLLAADLRCLDAHAHLGNLVFDHDPTQALRHYEVGAAIGELTLGPDFDGVLPWGLVDNRPYLRCLHGVGLSAWRLGERTLARTVFGRLLWLNPDDQQGARFCLEALDAGRTWEEMNATFA